ncbi:MAG: S-layer protein domain-containing protein, partial [Methanolobus sp.]|nr:S-layer protein domain-containing protein [Methanolobus sp.]
MKRFTTIALVALLAIAALIVPAAAQMDAVEVRSNVYNGTQAADGISITPAQFSGFFYDIDDNIGSEMLNVTTDGATSRTIPEGNLTYSTAIEQVEYAADFASEGTNSNNDSYPVLGLFAEKYVATSDTDAGDLVKLLLDSDDKYTLRTGSALELPNGYELTAKQIDVDGNKVWMELSKDGEFIEDEVLNVEGGNAATWTYDADVGDTDDVIVFRVLVTQVFQGQVDSLAVVEGLYLVDYEDVLSLETGDEFGELEIDTLSSSIEMSSTGAVTLSRDDTVDIAEGMKFQVADNSTIRFYVMKEYTEPGTYEVRGSVATGAATWTPASFAGFFYDIDDDIGSEELAVLSISGTRTIPEGNLTYSTAIEQVE